MNRSTSSTRSVMMTRSLGPRRSWACCASCTLMDPSFPTLNLCGNEHSNCTPWAQRIVEPNLGLLAIQLLDFLYGEWGAIMIVISLLLQNYGHPLTAAPTP